MQGDRIAKAREAAVAAVQRLDERDYVSVVVFDDRIDVLAGAQTASEANKAAIVETSIREMPLRPIFCVISTAFVLQGVIISRRGPTKKPFSFSSFNNSASP